MFAKRKIERYRQQIPEAEKALYVLAGTPKRFAWIEAFNTLNACKDALDWLGFNEDFPLTHDRLACWIEDNQIKLRWTR